MSSHCVRVGLSDHALRALFSLAPIRRLITRLLPHLRPLPLPPGSFGPEHPARSLPSLVVRCDLLIFSRFPAPYASPFRYDGEEAYVATVLADTSPSFLKLWVEINGLPLPPDNWQSHMGLSASPVQRLKFPFKTGDCDWCWGDDRTEEGLFVSIQVCGSLRIQF